MPKNRIERYRATTLGGLLLVLACALLVAWVLGLVPFYAPAIEFGLWFAWLLLRFFKRIHQPRP